ncbi:FG-GAP-like repeat-containing protein [Tenggerimyces flavus]|uniref:FG-GAP-like repeat-containing protein n=1 Tax=Tenggerimyces flavus TaxID=1708749 RepID=A0ABV7YI84_9ACTN|nr:FG-GAP-like repeat-containing protein [Tenggerimyces flavus]MBM7787492.1 hypothetical protein [Tenggerimyces flavus]
MAVGVVAALVLGAAGTAAAEPAKEADFNGDGHPDLAVGGPYATVSKQADAGAVGLVWGSAKGLNAKKVGTIKQSQAAIPGEPGEYEMFGWALRSGDFDGDGYADLAVSTPQEDRGDEVPPGALFLVFGSPTGLTSAIRLDPPPDDDYLGWFAGTLTVGDYDKDGFDDLVVGMLNDIDNPAYLIKGKADLRKPGAATFVPVVTPNPPWSIGDPAAGDINGDSYDDLVVPRRYGQRTEALVYFGGASGLGKTPQRQPGSGYYTATGDLDNDGYDDIAFGDPSARIVSDSNGLVRVWYGSKNGLDTKRGVLKLTQLTPRIPDDPEEPDGFGAAVAIGDVNGNGRADLAIGTENESIGKILQAGKVFLIYGDAKGIVPATARIDTFTQDSPGVQDSVEDHDTFGTGLAFRDFNGDGLAELQVSAPGENGFEGSVTILKGAKSGLTGIGSQTYTPANTGIGKTEAGFGIGLDK